MQPEQFDQLITALKHIQNSVGFGLMGIVVTLIAVMLMLVLFNTRR